MKVIRRRVKVQILTELPVYEKQDDVGVVQQTTVGSNQNQCTNKHFSSIQQNKDGASQRRSRRGGRLFISNRRSIQSADEAGKENMMSIVAKLSKFISLFIG